MNRKAQVQTQIFVYVIAIVIVGLILVFGYNAIKKIGDRADEVSLIKFKSTIEGSFDSVRTSFGTVKLEKYEVPQGYEELCFVDLDIQGGVNVFSLENDYPLVYEAVTTQGNNKNAFLVKGLDIESYEVDKINIGLSADRAEDCEFNDGCEIYLCADVVNSVARVKLAGRGDHVFVKIP